MSITVDIKEFDLANFDQLSDLFISYYKEDDKLLSKDYVDWLYCKNPFGTAKVVVAYEEVQWVGFMALIPVRFLDLNSIKMAFYVVNVLVNPTYQGKNIFSKMIAVAKTWSDQENVILMGHPNEVAIKFWERAKMSFCEPLKPFLMLPKFSFGRRKVAEIKSSLHLLELCSTFKAPQQNHRCTIDFSIEYIVWRYLNHPSNKYRLYVFFRGEKPVSLIVSRKIYPFINLLLDCFCFEKDTGLDSISPPLFTLFFGQTSVIELVNGSIFKLPIKKKIPFFFGKRSNNLLQNKINIFGLSASDF